MPFPDINHPWLAKPLGELFKLQTIGLNPKNYPREKFYHFSIPAWDELGGPAIDSGKDIDSNKYLLIEPCILVSKLNPRICRVIEFYPQGNGKRVCASTEIMAYTPINADINLGFYAQYMRSENFRRNLISAVTGTTNSHRRVRPTETLRWIVPFPSPSEQQIIATILKTLDNAIETTKHAIDAAQQARTSLITDLLEKGIDKKEKVRSAQKSIDSFTATPIGRLPSEWNLSTVKQQFDLQTGFTLNVNRRPRINKRPYLRVANLQRDYIDLSDVQQLEANDQEFELRKLKIDDLLVVEGHADRLQIGRCAMVTEQAAGLTFQNHLFRLRACSEITPSFGCFWLNSVYALKYWNARCATSSGLNTINQRMLKRLIVPVPNKNEQRAISLIINTQREHLNLLNIKYKRLEKLKQSLMQDLFSGKKNINISAIENLIWKAS